MVLFPCTATLFSLCWTHRVVSWQSSVLACELVSLGSVAGFGYGGPHALCSEAGVLLLSQL